MKNAEIVFVRRIHVNRQCNFNQDTFYCGYKYLERVQDSKDLWSPNLNCIHFLSVNELYYLFNRFLFRLLQVFFFKEYDDSVSLIRNATKRIVHTYPVYGLINLGDFNVQINVYDFSTLYSLHDTWNIILLHGTKVISATAIFLIWTTKLLTSLNLSLLKLF